MLATSPALIFASKCLAARRRVACSSSLNSVGSKSCSAIALVQLIWSEPGKHHLAVWHPCCKGLLAWCRPGISAMSHHRRLPRLSPSRCCQAAGLGGAVNILAGAVAACRVHTGLRFQGGSTYIHSLAPVISLKGLTRWPRGRQRQGPQLALLGSKHCLKRWTHMFT